MFSFNKNKVNTNMSLGQGGSGSVYAYQTNMNDPKDNSWAVKILTTKKIEGFIRHIQEVVLGFSLDHHNLLPIKGFHIDYDGKEKLWQTYLKIPRMTCSLKSRILKLNLKKVHFSEDEIAKYFYDLVCGLQYLHRKGIAHRDIKPDNILIDDKENILKIGDIGIGKFVGDETSLYLDDFSRTPAYSAPEISTQKIKKRQLFEADKWSLGVVMMELCLMENNIMGNANSDEKIDLVNKKLKQLEEKKEISKVLLKLISGLLESNPSDRISLLQVQKVLERNYLHVLKKEPNKEKKNTEIKEMDQNFQNQAQVEIALKKDNIEESKIEETTLLEGFLQNDKMLEQFNTGTTMDFTDQKIIEDLQYSKIFLFQEVWDKKFQTKISDDLKSLCVKQKINNLLTNDDLLNYIKYLPELKKLKQLEIDLRGFTRITDEGIKDIAQLIGPKFTNVTELKLHIGEEYIPDKLSHVQISDDSFSELANQLEPILVKVERLTLSFPSCKNITDAGITILLENIGYRVSQIMLDFSGCILITDDTIYMLANLVSEKLKKLNQFDIHLKGTGVTEEVKLYLHQELSHVPEIKRKDGYRSDEKTVTALPPDQQFNMLISCLELYCHWSIFKPIPVMCPPLILAEEAKAISDPAHVLIEEAKSFLEQPLKRKIPANRYPTELILYP